MSLKTSEPLSIVVVGASGDLARKKIFPALFALFSQDLLPDDFKAFGFARSVMDDDGFRTSIMEHLTCRYVPGEDCAAKMDAFLARCHYISGDYSSSDSMLDLYQTMQAHETTDMVNRLFYLAIPPSVFIATAESLGAAGLVACDDGSPWSRVVVEKPFGRDRASSDKLAAALGLVFTERQIFRIDHYLGKEVIQNLLVLRFSNAVFEPLLNCEHVAEVHIDWSENLSLEGRAGYFDKYGIIRDVMQNHLLEMLALLAMDQPQNLTAAAIRKSKVNLLKSIAPPELEQLVTGQFSAGELDGREYAAYTADKDVPDDSLTPTYAAVRLHVDNPRWKGVPFVLSAGKGLASRCTNIRVRFKQKGGGIFELHDSKLANNELVIRVQPDEGIHLSIVTKIPGLGMKLGAHDLDLSYGRVFKDSIIPDAYEGLLLDVLRGDRSLFISGEELSAAWDIFTPALHQLEQKAVRPQPYPFGGIPPELP